MLTIFKLLVSLVFWFVICLYLFVSIFTSFEAIFGVRWVCIHPSGHKIIIRREWKDWNEQTRVCVNLVGAILRDDSDRKIGAIRFRGDVQRLGKGFAYFLSGWFLLILSSTCKTFCARELLGRKLGRGWCIVLFWPHAFSQAINSGTWLHCFMTFSLSCGVTDEGWNTYRNKRGCLVQNHRIRLLTSLCFRCIVLARQSTASWIHRSRVCLVAVFSKGVWEKESTLLFRKWKGIRGAYRLIFRRRSCWLNSLSIGVMFIVDWRPNSKDEVFVIANLKVPGLGMDSRENKI